MPDTMGSLDEFINFIISLFKSKYGRRFKEKSPAVKRAPGFQPSYVIVYAQDYFGIFDIQEYTAIIAEPP